MKQKQIFTSAGRYLTHDEVQSIKVQLKSQDIRFIVKGHGPNVGDPMGHESSEYFEIDVESDKVSTAKDIVHREKVKRSISNRKCPKCGHLGQTILKKNLFESIIFIGTTRVECRKCKKRYFV